MIKDTTNPNIRNIAEAKQDKYNRLLTYIRLDYTASPETTVTCLICHKSVGIPNSDSFAPYKVWTTDANSMARQKMLRTNKDKIKWFQEEHWKSCIMNFNATRQTLKS